MRARLYLAQMRRESRGSSGRLVFFIASLAVGVAAVVAVAGLARGLDDGIRGEARQLLAADLAVEGRQPPPPELDRLLAAASESAGGPVEEARVTELVTVAAAPPDAAGHPGRSQLVELKAVGPGYPFYGTLRLDPDRPLGELLTPESVVVAPDLLPRLGLALGGSLVVGGKDYRIAGTVLSEPDRVGIGLSLGPRVFLSQAGLARSGLVARGSRIEYRTLVKLPPGADSAAVARLADTLRRGIPEYWRVQTYRDAQPRLRRGIRRSEHFLGLVALLSLLVGGIGVAQVVRTWLAGRLEAIAVLKCLGLRPREIVTLYLGQAAFLGTAGSLLGMAAGTALLALLPYVAPGLVPPRLLAPFQPVALVRGLALGLGTALVFSAPPLAAVWKIPPARVLRRNAEPLPGNRRVQAGAAIAPGAGIYAMAAVQSGSVRMGAQFTAGVAGAALALALAAWLLTQLAARLPRDFPRSRPRLWLRHGIAALGRPGASTLAAIVALGLGVVVVVAMAVVEARLASELTAEVPADAPTAFLVDVQPDQWPGVEHLLAAHGGHGIESVPVVMARLAAIDGTPVEKLTGGPAGRGEDGERRDREEQGERRRGEGSRRWALTREQRLTYMATLPKDNRIVAGSLWSRPGVDEVSLEEDFAHDLGVHLGSVLDLDVQGVPVELTVTSLRRVDWGTFDINFFLVVEPGVLEGAPQQRLATVRLPPGSEQPTQDALAARFPNVTFLPVREILAKIVAVIERIGLAVRFLGAFTVLAGIAILAGSVTAASAQRGREVALLKTLGVTRRGVAGMFSVEHALVGLVAGAIGAVGGGVLAWAVLTRGMDLGWSFHPLPYLVAVAASALLAAAAGVAASSRALARRPIEVLRQEE